VLRRDGRRRRSTSSSIAKFGADGAIRGAGSADPSGLCTRARATASSGSSLASDRVTSVPKLKFVAAIEMVLGVDSVEEVVVLDSSGLGPVAETVCAS
jgi:hypothetical protein